MDSLELFLFCFSSSLGWPDNNIFILAFCRICGHEVFPSWWHTLGVKQSPSYIQRILDWPLFLSARNARMCYRRCLHSSMISMLCTAFWVPSRAIQTTHSMLPTSWIVFFDSGLNGLYDWFCPRSCSRACRSGWFSIFWINSRTLVLCACFTAECGSPGIRKCMSASFTIIFSWLKLSWSITGLSVLSRSVCVQR